MNYRIILIPAIALVFAACGGGSSSPTTPAQIPTSIEYAGGAVEGDISVLTSKTIQFVAKDSSGNLVDASGVTTTLTTPDTNLAMEPGIAKALTSEKGAITGTEYGTCSLNTSNSSYIDCTGPDVLPADDVNPRVAYTFTYGDTTLSTSAKSIEKATELGSYTGRLGVSADTINSGKYSFSQVLSSANCNGPKIASNGNGWVFMACLYVISPGNGTIRIYWSNDDGKNWSGPNEEITGVNNTNVIRAQKTTEDVTTATAYIAYNGSLNTMYIRTITGAADGGITIGSTKSASGGVYDIASDANGIPHVLSSSGTATCQADPDEYIKNLEHRIVTTSGGFGVGTVINGTNCSVKANPGAEPRIAVTPDGLLAYATWRDIGSGGDTDPDITYVKVAEINTSNSTVNWEKTAAATAAVSANSVLAAGQYATTDKDGNMALMWDESVSDSATMRTFLSTLDGSTDAFSSYLVSTMAGISNYDPLLYSGTAVQIDYAGEYHMFYRNVNLLYTMGTISDSALTMTTPIDMSSTGTFSFGALSTDADWSGKNYITWQETDAAIVAVGTTD